MKASKKVIAAILAAIMMLCMIPAAFAEGGETNATYYNNATINAADPYVLYDPVSGFYYAYSTAGASRGYNFGVYRSPDLVTWEKASNGAIPTTDPNLWGSTWFWAPEVYYNANNGLYYIFYSAMMKTELRADAFKYADFEEACKIGVAVSDKPEGPFMNISNMPIDYFPYDPDYYDVNLIMDSKQMKPPATQEEGKTAPMGTYIPTIDADVFFDDNGRIYLYYSRNAYRNWVWDDDLGKYIEESNIYAVELNTEWWSDPTGKTMPTVKAEYINANKSADDPENVRKDGFVPIINYGSEKQAWENAHVNDYTVYSGSKKDRRWAEGSTTIKYYFDKDGDGKKEAIYYILYSCNNYENENYGVGYAVADNPLGPWNKFEQNPILCQSSELGIYSTGHGSVISTPDGSETYYVYHARSSVTGGRRLYTDRLYIDEKKLDENGLPVMSITKSTSDQPVPAGVAPYSISANVDAVVVDLMPNKTSQCSVEVKSAAGANMPLSNALNRVSASIADSEIADVTIKNDAVTVTGKKAGTTTLTLTYQRLKKSGEYYDITNGDKLVSVTVPVVVNPAIVVDTVTASCGGNVAVNVTCVEGGNVTSARFSLDSALPIASIESKYDFEYNPENGKVVVYDAGGAVISGKLITINYDLTAMPWYANGTYPINIELIDATSPEVEGISVGTVDGAIILDNDYPAGDADLSGNVTNADVIAIARYLVKLIDFTAKQMETADFDGNGVVNDADLVKVARAVVGAKF